MLSYLPIKKLELINVVFHISIVLSQQFPYTIFIRPIFKTKKKKKNTNKIQKVSRALAKFVAFWIQLWSTGQ